MTDMISTKALQNRLHRFLARSRTISRLAVKIRNQSNCIIAYHLGPSADSSINGEYVVVDHIGKHCKTFIDVGANVGDWADYMLSHSSSQGFLYEPSKECVIRLNERFGGSNVVVRDIAVSDIEGEADFVQEPNYGEESSLTLARDTANFPAKKVKVSTLDHEFQDSLTFIDYLKIDAEGYDLKVLQGSTDLLESKRIRFIQFEYNSFWANVGSTLAEANRLLTSHGFKVYLIRSDGLYLPRWDYWGEYFRYSNYFACQPSDSTILSTLIRGVL